MNLQEAIRKYLDLATYEKQNFIKNMNLDISDYMYNHGSLHEADLYFFNYIKSNDLTEKFITFIDNLKFNYHE